MIPSPAGEPLGHDRTPSRLSGLPARPPGRGSGRSRGGGPRSHARQMARCHRLRCALPGRRRRPPGSGARQPAGARLPARPDPPGGHRHPAGHPPRRGPDAREPLLRQLLRDARARRRVHPRRLRGADRHQPVPRWATPARLPHAHYLPAALHPEPGVDRQPQCRRRWRHGRLRADAHQPLHNRDRRRGGHGLLDRHRPALHLQPGADLPHR